MNLGHVLGLLVMRLASVITILGLVSCESSPKASVSENTFAAILQEQCRAIGASVSGYHNVAPRERRTVELRSFGKRRVDTGGSVLRMIYEVRRRSEEVVITVELENNDVKEIFVKSKRGRELTAEIFESLKQRLPAVPAAKLE